MCGAIVVGIKRSMTVVRPPKTHPSTHHPYPPPHPCPLLSSPLLSSPLLSSPLLSSPLLSSPLLSTTLSATLPFLYLSSRACLFSFTDGLLYIAPCSNYLCPGTLSCVSFPHHCPCAWESVEDKVELGSGIAVCASKGGYKEGETARKIELARKGLL
ncbi:hypothetical protein BCR34DRAFT_248747 [Clohesyomyces aquaticus]|uniref:Long chronological lifespan protein 2 n=1 Tax=Clohesyomyces aquaticus TaxID=1231657 RepID=A0A1Y1Y4D7_9PLEO|nr:hypothetical protein BCR34DRAFT_248747 [Clohesyomyces aquaticus]